LYLEPVAKLLEAITSKVSRNPKIWQLYAQVQDARGQQEEATDCRLKVCRSLQVFEWKKSEKPSCPTLFATTGRRARSGC
jgi:hypothetical protein